MTSLICEHKPKSNKRPHFTEYLRMFEKETFWSPGCHGHMRMLYVPAHWFIYIKKSCSLQALAIGTFVKYTDRLWTPSPPCGVLLHTEPESPHV